MGFRAFVPVVAACPGCGRTTSTVFQELAKRIEIDLAEAMPVWREKYPGVEAMKVAVMGCIVNGPGESKHADIGISLPGTGEQPAAPVFIDGKKAATLRGPTLAEDFRKMVGEYVEAHPRESGDPGVRFRAGRLPQANQRFRPFRIPPRRSSFCPKLLWNRCPGVAKAPPPPHMRGQKEKTLAASSKTDAEARYAKAQKRVQEAAKAQTEAQSEAKRVDANTVRLRALRLAKEAADLAAAAAAPPPARKKAKAKTAKSIPVEALNAANDE